MQSSMKMASRGGKRNLKRGKINIVWSSASITLSRLDNLKVFPKHNKIDFPMKLPRHYFTSWTSCSQRKNVHFLHLPQNNSHSPPQGLCHFAHEDHPHITNYCLREPATPWKSEVGCLKGIIFQEDIRLLIDYTWWWIIHKLHSHL